MNPFEEIIGKADFVTQAELPKKWKKIGYIIILDLAEVDSKKKNKVAEIYAEVLNAKTIIQKKKISGELRKPENIELLYGNETITEISEYGVKYKLDLAEIMWSPGNTGWRSALSGPGKVSEFYTFNNPKVIIDYFAGIGYFSIQMAKGYPNAKVIAIDKNPTSIEYLSLNAKNNNVITDDYGEFDDFVELYNGGNDSVQLSGVSALSFLDKTPVKKPNCVKNQASTKKH